MKNQQTNRSASGTEPPNRIARTRKIQDSSKAKNLSDATVPSFLPDTPEIRSDILDYYVEIEWFDSHLARILKTLEDKGELDNTLIIVTADNGMPFPRAKANGYELGVHVPLAIMWNGVIPPGTENPSPRRFRRFRPHDARSGRDVEINCDDRR